MRRLFDHMLGARNAALGALRPGVTCADVDQAVLTYFEANGILHYWKQHTGHAIGLRNHEAPFLDIGDFTPIEPGMVFTIEPGVYDGELGGFRHSDTALVTPDGFELLTSYPTETRRADDPGVALRPRRRRGGPARPSGAARGRAPATTSGRRGAGTRRVGAHHDRLAPEPLGLADDPLRRLARPEDVAVGLDLAALEQPDRLRATLSRCSCHSLAFGRSHGDGRPNATP